MWWNLTVSRTVSSILSSVKSRPNSEEAGPEVVPPFNETWAAMESLVDSGLVRSIGVSNFSPEKIQTLLKTARIRPAVNQVRPVTLQPLSNM